MIWSKVYYSNECMIVVYAFIGILPDYSVTTVKQLRFFYQGDIYFIVSDLESPYISLLQAYGVQIISYEEVKHSDFNIVAQYRKDKFMICHNLKGRENLFIYSFERFFVLHNLMKLKNLEHVVFLELDNLVYATPEEWIDEFSKSDLAFLYDNFLRCSGGVFYAKTYKDLEPFLFMCLHDILTSENFLNEMLVLYTYWHYHKDKVQLLPVHWPHESLPEEACGTFGRYGKTIFDALPIGVFLTGLDPVHTGGEIKIGERAPWSKIIYTQYSYEWRKDEQGRKIPYIYSGTEWLRINNLHVHSKNLTPYLSIE